jgi:AraC-like DNA-binding protein
MQPVLERLPIKSEESFVVKYFDYRYYPTPWHFHPEYELVLVTGSTGQRFIGDNISTFRENDLALIGPNLPHLYKNGAEYYHPKSKLRAQSIVVHFLEHSFGGDFLSLPEARRLKRLLARSARGLDILGKTNEHIGKKMLALCSLKGFPRMLKLLEILQELSESRDYRYISNEPVKGLNAVESSRMNEVFDFVFTNYQREIRLEEVASLSNLAVNSFSRFFSQRTRKTFTSFLNEVRLGQATKLLINEDKSVSEVCFACGFNNLSNFNRQFKKVYKVSPLIFRQAYWKKIMK